MLARVQKILSGRGIASRRKAEEYILAGLVKVNGKVAALGQKADPKVDRIEVDGKVLQDRLEMLYYVMNKPVGVLTENLPSRQLWGSNIAAPQLSREREKPKQEPIANVLIHWNTGHEKESHAGVKTIYDLLPPGLRGKIFPVGRLDKDSSGLLLFTNDGVLAYRLTHPKFQHDKEYEVTLDRPFSPEARRKIKEGFMLDGSMTKPLQVHNIASSVIRITVTEGRNRQIRRMCQNVGYTVKGLKRVRIMTLSDDRLKPGTCRALTQAERVALLRSVGL